VKKTVLAAGGFIVLGVLCYVGASNGQTQQQTNYPQQAPTQPQAAAPRTRIALLNLTYVIKNYEKYKHFQDEIKVIIEPFQKKDAELRQAMEKLRQEAGPTTPQTPPPPDLERRVKDLQRQAEDNQAEAKLKLGQRSDEEMKILFMDVYDAATRYANSHDFELVLHYNDAIDRKDFLSAQNIARKLNTGALMPLICVDSLDISKDIVNALNYNMSAAGVPGGAAPQGAPPAGGQR
jgi:Skp family chaperone for outer membrane proteins